MVDIRVEVGDVLERPTELLVLKHAQALYGADLAVVNALGTHRRLPLPPPGEDLLVVTGTAPLAAHRVLFVGVEDLSGFDYGDVREFGRRAVAGAHRHAPDSAELCLTLHGVGFGLDEAEVFLAELAGITAGAAELPSRSPLARVVVLERDVKRARRLEALLADVPTGALESSPAARDRVRGTGGGQRRPMATAGLDEAAVPRAFVAMPFSEDFGDLFHYAIAPPLKHAGMLVERMDQLSFTGDVVEMMRRRIEDARIVVAELTTANPNVYLEVGYAWAAGRPTVLLCRDGENPSFDVRGHRFLRYSSMRELEDKLSAEVSALLSDV